MTSLKHMPKALVLLSGGLDSMLAAKILMEQGVSVTGLVFRSCFFSSDKAKKAAAQLGVDLLETDFSADHLKMVKNPVHGYGKNMNPCIDCHGLMLKRAKEIMAREGYDLVATGEVLGQRPMSQHQAALDLVAEISGLSGKILRPLSAKLLAETEAEKVGKISRHRLLDISGRSRQRQIALAAKYNIKEYASPGGGCLLTDPVFSEKLLKLFEYWPDCGCNDAEILQYGRVFWLKSKTGENILVVIGRQQEENERLENLARTGDILIDLAEENGPTSLIRGIENKESGIREMDIPQELKMSELKICEKKSLEKIINLSLMLTGYYATKARGKRVGFKIIKIIK